MTVIVRGAFSLVPDQPTEPLDEMKQGQLTAEVFDEDDSERKGACLYPGDLADFKPRADVMLKGTCHPRKEKPVPACPVVFGVGGWSKELLVIGDRSWKKGLLSDTMSDPEPFSEMPLGFARAFGGPGFAINPAGKGFDGLDLPNVEYRDKLIRKRRDRPTPASFGPTNPAWLPRAKMVGKEYGDSWKKKRAPYYAVDFDWNYFNAAPADQQLPGYLKGDEELRFKSLHPESSDFKSRLPALRVRVFFKNDQGTFHEVPTNLDTLFADLDEGKLYLTWRGLAAIGTDDMTDVTLMLVDSEPLAEARPVDGYRQALDAFEKDPLGLDDQPEDIKAGMQVLETMENLDPKSLLDPDGKPVVDAVSDLIGDVVGKLAPEQAGAAQKMIANLVGQARKLDLPLDAPLKEATAKAAGAPPLHVLPGGVHTVRLAEPLRQLSLIVEQVRASAKAAGVDLQGLDKVDALFRDPRLKQIDPGLRLEGEPPAPDVEPGPGADLSGRDLSQRDLTAFDLGGANLESADLSGSDLTGVNLKGANLKYARMDGATLADADLSGTDLTNADLGRVRAGGADFSGAKLTQANLTQAELGRATLVEADLDQAVLFEADLAGAKLCRAKLTQAILSQARAPEIDLSGATLDQSMFDKADLTGGVLVEIKARLSLFDEAILTGLQARGADLNQCSFTGASLEDADFREAKMESARFDATKSARIDLRGSTLTKSSFAESDLAEAKLQKASGYGAIFNGAKLHGTDLSGARFPESHFAEAEVTRAKFTGADLRGSRWRKAVVSRTEFTGTNLFSADLSKTSLTEITFRNANLYDAKLYQATLKEVFFPGANLKRALMETS